MPQLLQAQSSKFNPHVHVEYEWWLGQDDMYESDEDLDEKVRSRQALGCGHACRHCPTPTGLEQVLLHLPSCSRPI